MAKRKPNILFIQADPHERCNRIDSADAKLIARYRRKLIAWGAAACTQVWIDPSEELVTLIMMQHRPTQSRFPLMRQFQMLAYQALA